MGAADDIEIINVTAKNVDDVGIFCVKDKKSPGYKAKVEWFKAWAKKGLKIKIAVDMYGKQIGFIEYIPSEFAWRPVIAENYLFIHCIGIFAKDARHKGAGSLLIQECINDAIEQEKSGVCTFTSDGPWMADKMIFVNNGFESVAKLDRFELMYIKLNKGLLPVFNDWIPAAEKIRGWSIVYSDQCPWHVKSVDDICKAASQIDINIKVKKITTPVQAQKAPSGFGTFGVIKDGEILADHYISATRFKNIVKQVSG